MTYSNFLCIIRVHYNITNMNALFIETHLNIGLFLKKIIEESQLHLIEFIVAPENTDIAYDKNNNPYVFDVLAILAGAHNSKFNFITWKEEPKSLLTTYCFDEDNLEFIEYSYNYSQFIEKFHEHFPLLNNQDFLHYLFKKLPHNDGEFSYARINRVSIVNDIKFFWGEEALRYKAYKILNSLLPQHCNQPSLQKI